MASRLSQAWSGLRNCIHQFIKAIPGLLCDLGGFAGSGLISYGAWLIYEPAGFLVAGMLLIAFALLIGRRLDTRKE